MNNILDGDVTGSCRSAVGKLNGTPQSVEFLALINMHHTIHWWWSHPQLRRGGGEQGYPLTLNW